MARSGFTVSQVARLSLVSVRTLHHYDEIGLLRPSARSEAGYRLYGERDLERLQQILFFRELEFSLDEVARILDDPQFDLRAALEMQRQMLTEKSVRVSALIRAVDDAIARLEKGDTMGTSDEGNNDPFQAWREFRQEEFEEETKQRWGHTDAYKESKRRTGSYSKQDWERLGVEAGAIYETFAALMQAGSDPTSPAAMDAAEQHRQHISRWFYPCPRDMHRGLGELYVSDPRFTANIDRVRAGMSQYMKEAFRANADRGEAQLAQAKPE
jgi:MerR family transcriptional regulator, thiopeptide resistance regulator